MKNSVSVLSGRRFGVLCSLLLFVFLSGCLDDENRVEPVPVGFVSIYNASPDAPELDIVVDNRKINNRPFDYTDHFEYLNFYTGERNIRFNAMNAVNALLDTTLRVEEGKAYSLFVVGQAAGIKALIVQDSTGMPAGGKAMARVVHLSPDVQGIDLVADTQTEKLFSAVEFMDASAFKEVDAATYNLKVNKAGTEEALLSVDDLRLQAGGYYTIIIRGLANPPAGNTHGLSMEVL